MLIHPGLLRFGHALCVGLALSACAPVTKVSPLSSREPLVWPEPPAAARIAFVRSFSRAEDLGIGRGFFQRFADLFAGPAETRMVRPTAVLAAPDGVLFVADPGVKGVHRFDPNKGRYDLIRRKNGKPLPSPVGLTMDGKGRVYVSDSFLRGIFVIAPGATIATPLPLKAELHQPTGIAADPVSGRLYVVDTAEHRVMVFNADGTLYLTFGRRGAGDGQFNYPTMIWRDNTGRLLVTDSLNFRIQMFDEDGKFLGKFGKLGDGTGDLSRPKGVAADRFGHIYVVDAMFHAIQVFDRSGAFLLHVGGQGHAAGEFWLPTGIFIGPDNTIYVADSYNQRVQVFRYIGGRP